MIDPTVNEELDDKKYRPKNHPGVMKVPVVTLPEELHEAVQNVNEREYLPAFLTQQY